MPVLPFMPVPNAAQVIVKSTLDGEACYTGFGFVRIAAQAVTQVMVDALVVGLADKFQSTFLAQLPALYIMGKVVARALDVEDGWQSEQPAYDGTPGGLAGPILPNNCSLAVAIQTGMAGRANRGRSFWPSFLESEVTNQRVLGGKQTSIVALYNDLMGDNAVAAGWRYAVISRKIYGDVWQGRALPITKVLFNDAVVDSMRRRLPGRGA